MAKEIRTLKFPGDLEPREIVDAKAREQLSQLSEDMANGLTDAEKALMLSLFKAAAYTENVSAKVTQLEALWSGSGDSGGDSGDSGGDSGGSEGGDDTQTFTVTNNLTNVTNSNSATTASGYYSATLSIGAGYEYTSLSITMGGVDITDSVYGDGGILIIEVTGDIVITASAQLIGLYPVYQLADPTAFDGSNTVDTGYALFDKGDDKNWTLLLDFSSNVRAGSVIVCGDGFHVFSVGSSGYYWYIYYGSNKWNKIYDASNGLKYAITHVAGARTVTIHHISDGAVVSETQPGQQTAGIVVDTSSILGSGFTGTINACEIYERILSADEISAFMGVA